MQYTYKNKTLSVIAVEREYEVQSVQDPEVMVPAFDLLVDLGRQDGERCRVIGAWLVAPGSYSGGVVPENIESKFDT